MNQVNYAKLIFSYSSKVVFKIMEKSRTAFKRDNKAKCLA